MIALRLFLASDTSRQLDMRTIDEGETLTIGRDASAGWALSDPERALSRLHLKMSVEGGAITATDTSTNGVMFLETEERLPRDKPVSASAGQGLRLGPYALMLERMDDGSTPVASASHTSDSPFAPTDRNDFRAPVQTQSDPFASALLIDPMEAAPARDGSAFGKTDGAEPAPHLTGDDDWSRPTERKAGDWDAPRAARDPGEMIGSSPSWKEPPPAEKADSGFGFDAPFTSPMLSEPVIGAADLVIPSDWDAAIDLKSKDASAKSEENPLQSPLDATPVQKAPVIVEPLPTPTFVDMESATNKPVNADAAPIIEPSPSSPEEVNSSSSSSSPTEASAAAPPSISPNGDRLIEAFCAGAKLETSIFAREDPEAVMGRLGEIYRHLVLGLSDVMGERTALRNEYRMVRTTVMAQNNNLFKWAPPQKVAAELLLASNEGFMSGPDAVTDSFQDVKKHLLCMLAGLRAALSSTLDGLAPTRIESSLKEQTFLQNRAASAWAEYGRVYAQLRQDAEDNADSPVNREFRAAYEKQLAELDRMSLR